MGEGEEKKDVIKTEMWGKDTDQTKKEREWGRRQHIYRCFPQIIIVIKEKGEAQSKITQITAYLHRLCSYTG